VPKAAKEQIELTVSKTMQMGLGEAIQRLFKVELLLQKGIAVIPENTREERKLIIEALNTHKLDLGFDCNLDGVPDTVEIFAKSAETSCCKIVNSDTSRSRKPTSSRRKPKAEAKAEIEAKAEAEAVLAAAAEAEEAEEAPKKKVTRKKAPAKKKTARRTTKK